MTQSNLQESTMNICGTHDSVTWSKEGLRNIIKSKAHIRGLSLDSPSAQQTETLLNTGVYLLCQLKGEDFSLKTRELIEFIDLENFMTLASLEAENISSDDRLFVRMLLKSIPWFDSSVEPSKQRQETKNAFCGVHSLLLSQHAEACTPRGDN